jgi:hypothetical protein
VSAPAPRRKKRVRPARKIVPRGQMGIGWIIGPLVLAAIIAILGVVFLLNT